MRLIHLLVVALGMPLLARAEEPAATVLLWPAGAPGSEGKTAPEKNENSRVSSVHKPSLTVYLPSREKATGAGVIVIPGGGHRYLAIDHEGYAVARWSSEHGIAAFVLKYRLAREEGSSYTIEEHALRDTQRALRLVHVELRGEPGVQARLRDIQRIAPCLDGQFQDRDLRIERAQREVGL